MRDSEALSLAWVNTWCFLTGPQEKAQTVDVSHGMWDWYSVTIGQTSIGKTMVDSHFIVLQQYWQIWHLCPHFLSFKFAFQELQEQWLSRTEHTSALLPVFHVDVCVLCSCSLPLLLNTISFLLGKSKVCSAKVLEVACERCKTQVLCIGCGGKDLLVLKFGFLFWLVIYTCNNMGITIGRSSDWTLFSECPRHERWFR